MHEASNKRSDVLAIAENVIAGAKSWNEETTVYQAGFFDGSVAGWAKAEFISEEEARELIKRLRTSIAHAAWSQKKPWWDLVSKVTHKEQIMP